MNHYELLAIISGKYAEPEAETILHAIEETVKKHASAFHYSQNLERKKLAYPIQHHSYGTYVLFEFDCDPRTLTVIDNEMRHTNEILRYQIIRKEKVGAPKELVSKELDRKDQKISTSQIASPQAPLHTRPHVSTPQYTPAPPSPTPTAHVSFQSPVHVSQKVQDDVSEKGEEAMPAIDLSPIMEPIPEKPQSESDDTKKKQKKVTYEDLDKKLDEILNNTIL